MDFGAVTALVGVLALAIGSAVTLGRLLWPVVSRAAGGALQVRRQLDESRQDLIDSLQERVGELEGENSRLRAAIERWRERVKLLRAIREEDRTEVHYLRNALQRVIAGEKLSAADVTPPPRSTSSRLSEDWDDD